MLVEFGFEINSVPLKKGMNVDEILCIIFRQLGRWLVSYILGSIVFVALIVVCGPVNLH